MKILIVFILIFIGCSSTKEVNSIKSIDKKVQRIENNLSSLNKRNSDLYKLFYLFDFGNFKAISYQDKKNIYKIEYNISYGNYEPYTNDNIDEFLRMGFTGEDVISRIGEIYFHNQTPILIKEKITRDLAYWSGAGTDPKTGKFKQITQTWDASNDYKIYVLDWDNNEIIIENLFGSLSKSEFNKDFYNFIIEEARSKI